MNENGISFQFESTSDISHTQKIQTRLQKYWQNNVQGGQCSDI